MLFTSNTGNATPSNSSPRPQKPHCLIIYELRPTIEGNYFHAYATVSRIPEATYSPPPESNPCRATP